jgi:hypothetical protein
MLKIEGYSVICVFQELKALNLIKTSYARLWVKTQSLKVLSSEMELAKSGIIRKVLIKRRCVEIPANFVGPLKIWRHLDNSYWQLGS